MRDVEPGRADQFDVWREVRAGYRADGNAAQVERGAQGLRKCRYQKTLGIAFD
jgi:hypothetical protein